VTEAIRAIRGSFRLTLLAEKTQHYAVPTEGLGAANPTGFGSSGRSGHAN